MQSVSSRIWTRVAVSYDDNDYTTGTSIHSTYRGKEKIYSEIKLIVYLLKCYSPTSIISLALLVLRPKLVFLLTDVLHSYLSTSLSASVSPSVFGTRRLYTSAVPEITWYEPLYNTNQLSILLHPNESPRTKICNRQIQKHHQKLLKLQHWLFQRFHPRNRPHRYLTTKWIITYIYIYIYIYICMCVCVCVCVRMCVRVCVCVVKQQSFI